jgi:hypothetical protein
MNYWYSSRPNEIFIDTDNFHRSIKHTCARLLGAIECGKLKVQNIEFHQSQSKDHVHTIITLQNRMPAMERYIWAMVLHSDIYRTAATIMRCMHGVSNADVLISPEKFKREPDDFCECATKHNAQTMIVCPAAIRLRGEDRIKGFFGKPDNRGWSLEDIAFYVQSQSENLFDKENNHG